MAPRYRCCSQHAYICDCAILSLPKDPQCYPAPSSLKSTVHVTRSMTRRLGPMMFIPMILWATSFVTIMAADSDLPFRYKCTL
jgi:hypothetical protein